MTTHRRPAHPRHRRRRDRAQGIGARHLGPTGRRPRDRRRPLTRSRRTASSTTLGDLVQPLPAYDRVSVGFPGVVREGRVLTAPQFAAPRTVSDRPSRSRPSSRPGRAFRSPTRLCEAPRQADPRRERRRPAGPGGRLGQRGRVRRHLRDWRRHRVVLRRHAGAPPRARPRPVPQGRDLQRAARRGRLRKASARSAGAGAS